MHYPHTIPPYEHQRLEQEDHWDTEWRALFWEQGLGKMKAGYDWALTLWQAGKIDTLIILAPNGVHRDWIDEGFKESNPNNIYDQPLIPPIWHDGIDAEWYHGGKAGNKGHQQKMRDLYASKKFVVLSMSYDSAKTKRNKSSGWIGGKLFLEKMLRERRCAFLLDEASVVQNPGSQITKTLVGFGGRGGLAKHALYRRILEGTPVDEGPFNAYPQMQFLDQDFWKDRGFANYQSFKTYFGIFRELDVGRSRPIPQLVAYQNLEELRDMLLPHSSRLLKRDVLDLPEKVHQHIRFEMSPEQWRMYQQLQEELMVEVKARGSDIETLLTAELPIVNVLRLYQITAGYIPYLEDNETGEPLERVYEFKENPRLENAVADLRKNTGKTVIWCRFSRDIQLLCDMLGDKAVPYYGGISEDERADNKRDWLRGDPQYLVPQIQSMARGHTLNIAPDVMYYTNDSRLRLRRQSEDRTHRGKMDFSVLYKDMLASDTVDEKRVKQLRVKLGTAETVMGDNL